MSESDNSVNGGSMRILSAAEAAASPIPAVRSRGRGRPSPRMDAIRGLEVGGRVEFEVGEGDTLPALRSRIATAVFRRNKAGVPALPFKATVRTVSSLCVAVIRLPDEAASTTEDATVNEQDDTNQG